MNAFVEPVADKDILFAMSYTLENYCFGRVTVNGHLYIKDLIVHGDQIIPNWRRKSGHSLVPEDIEPFLPQGTRLLIIGCGSPGMLKVPQETGDWFKHKGITLIAEPTQNACKRYNEMTPRNDVVIGLHLTC